jgi:hypothetical protein
LKKRLALGGKVMEKKKIRSGFVLYLEGTAEELQSWHDTNLKNVTSWGGKIAMRFGKLFVFYRPGTFGYEQCMRNAT